MKRYYLFSGETYYPAGGWDDFQGSFDTIEQAKAAAEPCSAHDWQQIVDGQTGKEIACWYSGSWHAVNEKPGEVCGLCGEVKPADQSCICFDNHCQ